MLTSLLLLSLYATVAAAATAMLDGRLDEHWALWKKTHGKWYRGEVNERHRRGLWEKNLMMITLHNLEASMGARSFQLGMNSLGDMTPDEIRQSLATLTPPPEPQRQSEFLGSSMNVPASMDWRDKGWVTWVKNQQGKECLYSHAHRAANCFAHHFLPRGDEDALQHAVASLGPISVAIDASGHKFAFYKSGVYDDASCSQKTNHAVLVVGYGALNGEDYWLVKNSWGRTFGDEGYIRMARNKNNQCGIALFACYPVMSSTSGVEQQPPAHRTANCFAHHFLPRGDEDALQHAVASLGPISVAIDASGHKFAFYKSENQPRRVSGRIRRTEREDYWLVKNSPAHRTANCFAHHFLPRGDEDALQHAVASLGPISVAIDASGHKFAFYKSGVYDDASCSQKTNHAVLVVGYGALNERTTGW
ncbi:cathepsin S-like [Entelurus aequoreus]|uniref:cathepsin S-like n=1 Tax=Entelurus aequoreus TaxID=161455 RepID=UPI002B1D1646|nr:cathepsin S-like [Entelurus aequoreus]